MAQYVPHTDAEISSMLDFIGLGDLNELFDVVPEAVRLNRALAIDPGASEFDVMSEMERLVSRNSAADLICFAGAGAYDHDVPAVVRRLAGRTEFITSSTPYQPEVAQGVLQALFEYQTLVSRITGREVANASLYDGGSACVEAVNLTVAATGKSGVLLSDGVHPNWRSMLKTMAVGTGHQLLSVALVDGVTDWNSASKAASTGDDIGTIFVQYPNYLGSLEDVGAARELADRLSAKLVVAFDPVSAGVLRTPGDWGADVVVGEGQAFGTPMALGGPYVGLFACRTEDVRRLPGRLVGETVDREGRTAYVTTLRTREQDIRREKASSNVCTNQTLIAVTAAIQMAWLGTQGLRELALQCARGTRYLREALVSVPGVESASNAPTLREFAVRTPVKAETLVERMVDAGFLAGVPLEEPYGEGLLIAVTEKRTRDEIDDYVKAFAKAVR